MLATLHGNQKWPKVRRNKVRKLTRQVKRDYEKNIAKEAKFNPKKFWQYVSKKTKTKTGISELTMPSEDGKTTRLTKSDGEKSDVLSKRNRKMNKIHRGKSGTK